MAELGTPTNNEGEAADLKGGPGGGRSKDDVALDLMKFIAVNAGFGKSGQTSAGFSAKAGTRSPEELAGDLLDLFDRCRKVVNKEL
ncbi:MAG: hypothetical protein ABSC05_29160 [Candidatus Solibacter sp.]|jgi:hypothetical protein